MTDATLIILVAAIAPTLASVGTLISSLRNRRDIAANTAITASTHVLVNDQSTKTLKLIAEQAERIASLSGLPDDLARAVTARSDYNAKLVKDAIAANQGAAQ